MKEKQAVLLIEDDQLDILLTHRAFQKLEIKNPLEIVNDGEEALNYLKKNIKNLPRYILLDLNLPRLNGREFLEIIKKDEIFKNIPVIILTTSNYIKDVTDCFNLSVAGYIVKPTDTSKLTEIIKEIHQYWSNCLLPSDVF